MRIIFKFIHPVLPITVGLWVIVAVMEQGDGGPCASPLILLIPISLLGVLIGLVLSGVRTYKHIYPRSVAKPKPE
jgi:hypothetical protein